MSKEKSCYQNSIIRPTYIEKPMTLVQASIAGGGVEKSYLSIKPS